MVKEPVPAMFLQAWPDVSMDPPLRTSRKHPLLFYVSPYPISTKNMLTAKAIQ